MRLFPTFDPIILCVVFEGGATVIKHYRFAGASGTGRTTFVNTLCESEVLLHKVCDSPETAHLEEGIRIKPVNVGA